MSTSPKRVIEVFDSLEISGGVQAVIMNVIRNADSQKLIIDVAAYQNPKENSYSGEVLENGGRVYAVSNLSSCGPLSFYRQFYRLFKDDRYDAVHAHNIHHNGLILLAAKRAGVPIRISHAHQSFDDRNSSVLRRTYARILCAINNRVATRRIACSDLAGRFLYGNKQFEFLPNAIDFTRFYVNETKENLKLRLGINPNNKVLINIGRFCAQKNQAYLIQVMKSLRGEDYVLLMVGDGPLFEAFENQVEASNLQSHVRCLGIRSDVPVLLKLADCMLLPSKYEGLPVVVVEAQAMGCPSIVSDEVTSQVDLDFGLVEFVALDSPDMWVDRIRDACIPKQFDQTKIIERMIALKFEIGANMEAWYNLYGCEE